MLHQGRECTTLISALLQVFRRLCTDKVSNVCHHVLEGPLERDLQARANRGSLPMPLTISEHVVRAESAALRATSHWSSLERWDIRRLGKLSSVWVTGRTRVEGRRLPTR